MFDSVWVKCPKCGSENEFQSKSGMKILGCYDLENAPEDVMIDVNRHSPCECEECGTLYEVDVLNRVAILSSILSFKEPSKETERCPHCNGSGGVKIGEFEYDTCPCVATKEPSSERPDFEKMAREYAEKFKTGEWFENIRIEAGKDMGERIWNDYVVPLDIKYSLAVHSAEDRLEQIQSLELAEVEWFKRCTALEQEIERLREELKSKQ